MVLLLEDHGFFVSDKYISNCIEDIKEGNRKANRKRRRKKCNNNIVEYRAKTLYNAAKSRAVQNDLKFDLTLEWILDKLKIGKCEKTNLKFQYNSYDSEKINPYTPSLDKIIPEEGYTKDNVQVVVLNYNRLKNDSEEVHALAISYALVRQELKSTKDKVLL